MQEMIRTFKMETEEVNGGFVAQFRPGALIPRDRVHHEGHWHKMIHLHLVNKSGLVLQRRRSDHEFWPNLLDAAVVGHVEGDDDIVTTAIRETKEEIGLVVHASELTRFGRFLSFHSRGDLLDLEIIYVFLLRSETRLQDLIGSESEIEELVAVPPADARQYLLASRAVPHPYYPALLKELQRL